jgi:putative ABC transport system substrate-binding protein
MLLAQSATRVYRIAVLDDAAEIARGQLWRSFRARLGELGLAEGRDVAFDARYANGESEKLPALAAELVALKPDLLVVASTPAAKAAVRASSSLPVLFIGLGDPVGSGLAASLARPAGNATGTSVTSPDFAGKWFELLQEITPNIKRACFLNDASLTPAALVYEQLQRIGKAKNVTIRFLDARRRKDLEQSFESIRKERIQGMIVGLSATLLAHRDQIVQFAAQNKIPAIYARREYVDAGGLLSYGADLKSAYTRGADYAYRILKGAKPAELPVEQMNSTRMVLNLKTAHALGVKIPDSFRARVDEVIE